MTQAPTSIQEALDEHVTLGLYASIALACMAFAGMLLAPGDHAEWLLTAAWVCMSGAIVCLFGRLALALLGARQPDGAAWRTPH